MIKPKSQKTVRHKAMDYLARRDHSERELIQKLKSQYPMDEILPTIEALKERGWLISPNELSEKVYQQFNRKNKSHFYIVQFLKKKGLPSVSRDSDVEFKKALSVVANKLGSSYDLNQLASLLKNRGFDTETIGKVIDEIRRNSPSLHSVFRREET